MDSSNDVLLSDEKLRELFNEIDLDGSGEIDGQELVIAMKKLGCPICPANFAVSKFSGSSFFCLAE
jgi:Ca2+-binding EF-hand superfamily protein